jgi:hypothetical protein
MSRELHRQVTGETASVLNQRHTDTMGPAVGEQVAEAWARVHRISTGDRGIIEALDDSISALGVPLDRFGLPLVKALRYFERQRNPPATARYFDCHIPLAIAVIDAPMVAARIRGEVNTLSLTPWVRVIRNEAVEAVIGRTAYRALAST